jgi:predicted nuclease of predicted toxin-antitoxin system
MRILLDECVDPRVKGLFKEHEVSTVQQMGWDQLTDGEILDRAQHTFDALVTIDQKIFTGRSHCRGSQEPSSALPRRRERVA